LLLAMNGTDNDLTKFEWRLLVSVDAKGYGSSDDQQQDRTQTALPAILEKAAQAVGMDRGRWHKQPTGDGELSILPSQEHAPQVIDDFVRELHVRIAEHNLYHAPKARLRLRLAIHHGYVKRADNGYAGQGVVAVARLVDSQVLKDVVKLPGIELAVILSQEVFEAVVRQRHISLAPDRFRKVSVANKEYTGKTAWIYTPGHDVHDLAIAVEHLAQPELDLLCGISERQIAAAKQIGSDALETDVPLLFRSLGIVEHPEARRWIIEALGRIGNTRALRALVHIDALYDSDRLAIQDALTRTTLDSIGEQA
jgi:hypothetical protein